MTANTEVNFKNNTLKPITVSPVASSVGRWNAFTLQPGEDWRRITDSHGGSGNYDIEFKVEVNPKGPNNDKLIGTFRADNPWYDACYMQSMTKDIWYAKNSDANDPIVRDGKAYYSQYYDSGTRMDIAKGKKRVFGAADVSKMDKYTDQITKESGSRYIDRFYTQIANEAFTPDFPTARVEYLGELRSSKAWNFVVDTL